MISDETIVEAAAAIAQQESAGNSTSPAVLALLRAAASTRDEQTRHEMARRASERVGAVGDIALQVLRIGIFALA
jgi:hypothetical protein